MPKINWAKMLNFSQKFSEKLNLVKINLLPNLILLYPKNNFKNIKKYKKY